MKLHLYSTRARAFNYDWYYKDYFYLHVATLKEEYASNVLWGQVYIDGGGSFGIPNDIACNHQGHHALFWVHVELSWLLFGYPVGIPVFSYWEKLDFMLGDDNPLLTDCWITVQPGPTDFSYSTPGGGGR